VSMIESEEELRDPVYGRILVWAMRLMAVLWFAKGLMHWSVVLGIGATTPDGFEKLAVVTQSATGFFAIIDLVAAVGLWMAAPWGGVIWLVAAIAYALIDLTMPAVLGSQPLLVLAIAGLIAGYLFVTYKAAREGSFES
jgi:hypothetical protein